MNLIRSAKGYSTEARKGMAVLGVAGLAVAGLVYVIASLHFVAADRLRQAESEHEMVAARAAKAEKDGVARLTEADNVAPMFLDGATPGLAFAKFQSIAGEAASAAGLEVKRMQPVDTGDAEATMPYRLNVDVEGSLEQMRDFLADVESGLPLMFVTGLEMQPSTAEGEGDQYPSEKMRMTVRIEAYGWRAGP